MMDWKPRNIVTSLHEHSGAVNRIAVSNDGLYFATASDDGSVRLWLSPRLERAAYSRSMLTYSSQAGRITDVCTIGNTHAIASASDQGSVHVFKVEHAISLAELPPDAGASSRARLGVSTILEIDCDEGGVCAVRHFNSVSESLLVYATERGFVHGWDIRGRREAWKLSVGNQVGLITALGVAPSGHWLCAGTSKGVIVLFDLRFHLVVKVFRHSSCTRIHRIFLHGGFSSKPLVYIAAGSNECCLWNVDTGACKQIFRVLPPSISSLDAHMCPSLEPVPVRAVDSRLSRGAVPLAERKQEPRHSIRAVVIPESSPVDTSGRAPGALISAGSDRQIRYWDTLQINNSYSIAASDSGMSKFETYMQSRELPMSAERMYVCQETPTRSLHTSIELAPQSENRGPVPPSPMHRDCVLDMQTIQPSSTPYLLSAGRDGIVKIWG